MEKKYEITQRGFIFNFSEAYVKNETEVLSSEAFKAVFNCYLDHVRNIENSNLLEIVNISKDPIKDLTNLFKMLISFSIEEISKVSPLYASLVSHKDRLYEFCQDFYDWWRSKERYGIVKSPAKKNTIESVNFIGEVENFNQLILKTYRAISQKLLGTDLAWELRKEMRDQLPNNRIINVFHFEDGKYGLDRLIEFAEYIAIPTDTTERIIVAMVKIS